MTDILNNKVLLCAITSWFLAQSLKVVIHYFVEGEFKLERFHGAGGMPSSHTSTIVALTGAVGYTEGFGSTMFAIAFVMATIVMHDASSVRRSVGDHAKLLNQVVQKVFEEGVNQQNLKELIGHKPLEVFAGAILGILVTLSFYLRF